MHRQHLDIQTNRGSDGFGYGVGDVVKFQIQEYGGPGLTELPNQIWSFRHEEFFTDLEGTDVGGDAASEV